jgi:uncharacterized protein YxeA
MKFVATFLVAVFVAAAGTSFAFADCTAHNKAQLVKKQDQEQVTKDQATSNGTQFTVAEKAADLEKSTSKTPDKK